MNYSTRSRRQSFRLGERITPEVSELLSHAPAVATRIAELAEGKVSTALKWPWVLFLLQPTSYTAPTLEYGRATRVTPGHVYLTEAVRSTVAWSDVVAIVTRETMLLRNVRQATSANTMVAIKRWQRLLKAQEDARVRYGERLAGLLRARAIGLVDGVNMLDEQS